MRILAFAFAMLFALPTEAATPQVPDALDDWRDWVLQGQEHRDCPLIAGAAADKEGDFVCAWPGVLHIRADADGADFSQRWQLQIAGWVPLPGNRENWPQSVRVDGNAAPVVDHNGPHLWLESGSHGVQARIDWDQRPQTLPVPTSVALIALEVDGAMVSPVQRNGSRLTLGRSAAASVEADSLDLRVFRRFTDNVPGTLTTRLRIQAAGQPREVLLGPALPDGFTPMSLDSNGWSARLEEDGRLRVQVQPGENTLTLEARANAPISQLVARVPEDWASQEIWSYLPVPALRITHASGALQIDPRQAQVPEEWQQLAAFLMEDGNVLDVEQRSRGLATDSANRLTLDREAWLNFSGDGWFARDSIRGTMSTGWRFDLAKPWRLERAENGSTRDQVNGLLITHGTDAALSGVEWRTPRVALWAGIRSDEIGSRMPVSGWQQVFDEVSSTLHLPYGYRLIAAPGTDRDNGSWLSQWTLLDLFLAAILTLLSVRTLGRTGGVLVALYLLLGFQEPDVPLWSLFAAIATCAAWRALPAGRLRRVVGWLRTAALLLLLLMALPFSVQQFRQALYPQLESETGGAYRGEPAFAVMMTAPPPPPVMDAAPPAAAPVPEPAKVMSRRSRLTPAYPAQSQGIKSQNAISQYSQSTVVQTGGGEPGWDFGSQYRLHWNGPVLPDQQVSLWIAPPWLTRPLRLLLVGLLGLVLWRLLGLVTDRPRNVSVGSSAALVLAAALSVPSAPVMAQPFPPDELLNALQERLTRAPECAPSCANLAQAQVSASDNGITVSLELHALQPVAVPLPADEQSLTLQQLSVDGVPHDAVVRRDDRPWIAVNRGVHRVELRFAAVSDRIALSFAMRPDRIAFRGDGWQSSGVADHRLLTETLAILRDNRGASSSTSGESAAAQQFPPYVRVFRQITLDLDWSVDSRVQRMAPAAGGFTIGLPIMEGEHVSNAGVAVKAGILTLAMADGQSQAEWQSTLDSSESLTLTAPDLSQHAEVWTFLVSPTWHVEFDGVPESTLPKPANPYEYHLFRFDPLPGEQLTVRISKPLPEVGATRAIDRLSLESDIGTRVRDHTLHLTMRASQGGEHRIRLPDNAELLALSRDRQPIGARLVDGYVSLPLNPGAQAFEVRFREGSGTGFSTTTPHLEMGLPSANIELGMRLQNDRWLLATFGPTVGPAVLLWGELIAMAVVAWLLSRWRRSPLRFHQWLLLGLGFSTLSWLPLLLVVAWLFALEWRSRHTIQSNWRFNLTQLGLLGFTAIALLALAITISQGLLGRPDMVIRGNGSSAYALNWFIDRSSDMLPHASVISLPIWVFNVAMLLWALWLAWSVVGWLRNGMRAWATDGYWRPWRVAKPAKTSGPEAPESEPDGPTETNE